MLGPANIKLSLSEVINLIKALELANFTTIFNTTSLTSPNHFHRFERLEQSLDLKELNLFIRWLLRNAIANNKPKQNLVTQQSEFLLGFLLYNNIDIVLMIQHILFVN